MSLDVSKISFLNNALSGKTYTELQLPHGSIMHHPPEEGHGSIVEEALGATFLVLPVVGGRYLHQVGRVSVLHAVVRVDVVVHVPVADRLHFHGDTHLQTATVTSNMSLHQNMLHTNVDA